MRRRTKDILEEGFFFICRVVTYIEGRGGSSIEDDGGISGGNYLKGTA